MQCLPALCAAATAYALPVPIQSRLSHHSARPSDASEVTLPLLAIRFPILVTEQPGHNIASNVT